MYDIDYASNYSKEDIENIFAEPYTIQDGDYSIIAKILKDAEYVSFKNSKQYHNFMTTSRKKYKCSAYSKVKMLDVYHQLVKQQLLQPNDSFFEYLKLKPTRGASGVNVVTIFTSGYQMGKNADVSTIKGGGCPMDCHYCPFEKNEEGIPTQPRSYLSTEPGNMRATQNKHHPAGQTFSRLYQLQKMGHITMDETKPSKTEFIISGGTFNFYPKDYIVWFVTCMYYACNTFVNRTMDIVPMKSLEEEQLINETSAIRIIGLTIETRPDYVAPKKKGHIGTNLEEVEFFRRLGVTRVQVGVQHTSDSILKKVNRKCSSTQNKEGIRILKQNGIKTDIHLMLDLPGSTPELDIECINSVVDNPDYQADQWKLYPTETTPYTKIKKWRDEGTYKPYSEDHTYGTSYLLANVLVHAMSRVPPYIRVNRVVRDIPEKSIEGGLKCGNFREVVDAKMKTNGVQSRDIRNREVKLKKINSTDKAILNVIPYISSSGVEYFIQIQSPDTMTLYGFCRLRLNTEWNDVLPALQGHAMVRELHVYGSQTSVGVYNKNSTQHRGYGTLLLKKAEEIAFANGYSNIVVISGIGVRDYYRNRGYTLYHTYMKKILHRHLFRANIINDIIMYIGILCLVISFLCMIMVFI